MALALFDTNIIIDYLGNLQAAFDEINHYADSAISAITWMETMAKVTPDEEHLVRAFLSTFTIIHTDDAIMNAAAAVRAASIARKQKIALPDAIIIGTAHATNRIIITRNKRDFVGPNVRVPYELDVASGIAINIRPPIQ